MDSGIINVRLQSSQTVARGFYTYISSFRQAIPLIQWRTVTDLGKKHGLSRSQRSQWHRKAGGGGSPQVPCLGGDKKAPWGVLALPPRPGPGVAARAAIAPPQLHVEGPPFTAAAPSKGSCHRLFGVQAMPAANHYIQRMRAVARMHCTERRRTCAAHSGLPPALPKCRTNGGGMPLSPL